MSTDPNRSLVPRTIGSTEVLVSTENGEIFLDVPTTGQDYIRVVEGELVREGDVRSRDEQELESQTLHVWTVDEITPVTVRGTDVDTGDSREWNREELEQKLADGTLSTNLTDFERADVHHKEDNETETDPPEVTVTAYGNDGQRFQQTFHPATGGETSDRQLEVSHSDPKVEDTDWA